LTVRAGREQAGSDPAGLVVRMYDLERVRKNRTGQDNIFFTESTSGIRV